MNKEVMNVAAYSEPGHDLSNEVGDVFAATLENVQGSIVTNEGREAAYVWRRDPDNFSWEDNVLSVFEIPNQNAIGSCRQFELLIAPEHVETAPERVYHQAR